MRTSCESRATANQSRTVDPLEQWQSGALLRLGEFGCRGRGSRRSYFGSVVTAHLLCVCDGYGDDVRIRSNAM